MRAFVFLSLLLVLLVTSASCAALSEVRQDIPETQPIALILVDELTWEEVLETSSLEKVFREGAVANLSTTQGAAPVGPRMGHVLLGAGSRVDASLLPESLPQRAGELPGAFRGPASSVQPGALGERLAEGEVATAAVGERARLVVMNREGRVSNTYEAPKTSENLEAALADGAGFVAVDAGGPKEAGRLSGIAREAGAVVTVASPTPPAGSANLTPFALVGAGEGLLYSPATRTRGLVSSTDVAPTLLVQLGVDPSPGMQGRVAAVSPGSFGVAVRLDGRLSFVTEERFSVWILVGVAMLAGAAPAVLRKRKAGAVYTLLVLAALPAGALVVAAVPITNVLGVAFLTLSLAVVLAALFWRLSGSNAGRVSGVFLVVSALILADTISGGTLMKLSTLGYNPAYGTRFYGIGNEYSAFLAGSLTVGVGALVHRRRLFLVPVLAVGLSAVLILGLPTMGADVGGSLALGLGFGATVGLLRKSRLSGLVFWTGTGLALAAGLFLTSGMLFPGVSHGSQAAGGETGLAEVLVRKLLLSLDLLLNPVFLMIFVVGSAVVLLAWRRSRGTAFGAGLLGAAITAFASGALNDSGILAAIFVLAYPSVAAGMFLMSEEGRENNKSSRVR